MKEKQTISELVKRMDEIKSSIREVRNEIYDEVEEKIRREVAEELRDELEYRLEDYRKEAEEEFVPVADMKLRRAGNTLCISIPKFYGEMPGIEVGMKMRIFRRNRDNSLLIRPRQE